MEKIEEGNRGPNAERFIEFEQSNDNSSFFLLDGKFFEFDQHKGWFDEYGNYYNCNGEPTDPPADANVFLYFSNF